MLWHSGNGDESTFIMFLWLQELFIQALARFSLEQSKDQSLVDYKDLAEIVNTEETLQFLQGRTQSQIIICPVMISRSVETVVMVTV